MARQTAWSALAALLAVTGCGSPGSEDGDAAAPAAPDAGAAAPGISPEEAGRLHARAITALAGMIADPTSARLVNLRAGSAGAICGEVATAGVSHPFVIGPDGTASISRSPEPRFEDILDPFPDLYMRYCATVEELRRFQRSLEGLDPADVVIADPTPGDRGGDPGAGGERGERELELEAPSPEPRARPPVPPRAQPRGRDDSFFNAVVRPAPSEPREN